MTSTIPPSSSTAAASATVRFATEADVPTILTLIHELAAYENASSSVSATESSLLTTLSFPSAPAKPGYARTLLIYPPPSHHSPPTPATDNDNDEPTEECAGLALYFHNYSTWRAAPGVYLEDLFVRPKFRGRGYGKRLLGELALETKRVGGERLEWSVLKWNEPSLKFYQGLGARRMEGWVAMRVDDLKGEGEGEQGGEEGGELERLGKWGQGVEWR
ncbi:MAG: hypothetical protein LQ339_003565 [Xanthoria mediterranea]|nr:MAG: hypothetical protein LQ339_003565 [Xanthoria mediterranea]